MVRRLRSGCPINRTVELFGDPWSLVVLRDVLFANRRTFGELLDGSEEGISSSVLADRLERLAAEGLLARAPDPGHAQKVVYSLTERSIRLLPLFVELGAWGRRHLEGLSPALTVRQALLEEGGPELREAFMEELREIHLHGNASEDEGVLARLERAFQAATGVGGDDAGGAS